MVIEVKSQYMTKMYKKTENDRFSSIKVKNITWLNFTQTSNEQIVLNTQRQFSEKIKLLWHMKMYYVKTVHIHTQTQGVGRGKREDIANQEVELQAVFNLRRCELNIGL